MTFTVYKLNNRGEEALHYFGEVIERSETHVCIRAEFASRTRDLGYVILKTGDVFTEWFYTDRWYNVFKVEDVDTGELKGYYCNVTRPAIIAADHVKADDLALDVFIKPDGTTLILDEDDYVDLPLSEHERGAVSGALKEIKALVKGGDVPFDALSQKFEDQ